MSFVHLHSHTQYSLLDGAAKIKEVVRRTVEMDMPGIAITDHGNLFGSLEFYTEAQKANIKPIIGIEAYIAPGDRKYMHILENESHSYHLVLLAKNEQGYKNLIKLSSYAYLEGMYYNRPRIDKELLRRYSEGLIATSACMKGEIAWKLARGMKNQAVKAAEQYIEIFGDDFYFEIQDHHIPEEARVYPMIYDLAKEMGVKVVATNDNHYLNHGDHEAHDVLICLQTGKDRDDPSRMRYGTEELYIKSPDEMFRLFKDRPQVLETTMEIFEKIDLKINFDNKLIPKFPIAPDNDSQTEEEYLQKLTYDGIRKLYPDMRKEVVERIDFELSVINKMGFAGYFLIVQDFINAAKMKDIPVGLGRGSAAGSLVAYALGITAVDPLRYDLLFERFLNPERISMPDIDIDFCVERRDEVIDYVREKYGKMNVAQIITFGTMASKGVIRDVARVLKVPLPVSDSLAKMVPMKGAKPYDLADAIQAVPELKEKAEGNDPVMRNLFRYSLTLEGLSRHASTHAAGIIIAPDDLTNYVPLYIGADKVVCTQWSMGWAEKIGLLKMDFLGLRNLTVIKKAEDMIRACYDPDFDINRIPMDDEKTFRIFAEAITVGVFQFESSGMQEYLKKLKPGRIEDLIAMNALYRPGPMSNIDDFIDCKYGRKKIEYMHPLLAPILEETYGIIVYQEQVMKIVSTLAGFSLAQADLLRRAMGKKKKEEMVKQKENFITGCLTTGIEKKKAEAIYDHIEKFAEYGFNKSHSAAYAIIAYQTAYLKAHYPAEFMSANLTSELSNSKRIMVLMDECKKLGLKIEAPDVNKGDAYFQPLDRQTIAFGLEAIKNVGHGAIVSIVDGRQTNGSYKNIFEMMQIVDTRLVNKKVLENLTQAGAFDALYPNRAELYYNLEMIIEWAQQVQAAKNKNKNQRSLFDGAEANNNPDLVKVPDLRKMEDWSVTEKLKQERELLGFYFSGHPLSPYKNLIDIYLTPLHTYLPAGNDEDENGSETRALPVDTMPIPAVLKIGGQIIERRAHIDKQGRKMAFVKVEDFNFTYDITVFGSLFPQTEHLLQPDQMVMVQGQIDKGSWGGSTLRMTAEKIVPLDEVPELLTTAIGLRYDKARLTDALIYELKMTVGSSPGKLRIYILVEDGQVERKFISSKLQVKMNNHILNKLCSLFGQNHLLVEKNS